MNKETPETLGHDLPFTILKATVSGNCVRIILDHMLDLDMKPNPEDFSVALPISEYPEHGALEPAALDIQIQPEKHPNRAAIVLVMDEAIPPVTEVELHYHPQQWLMWSVTIDEPLEAFVLAVPVDFVESAGGNNVSNKLIHSLKQQSPEATPVKQEVVPLEPEVRRITPTTLDISLNKDLIQHQGVSVNDFRAEAEDYWLTVVGAALYQPAPTEPHQIRLQLREELTEGETIRIAFKAKRYPITTLDGTNITNFEVTTKVLFEKVDKKSNKDEIEEAPENPWANFGLAIDSDIDESTLKYKILNALGLVKEEVSDEDESRKVLAPAFTWQLKAAFASIGVFTVWIVAALLNLVVWLPAELDEESALGNMSAAPVSMAKPSANTSAAANSSQGSNDNMAAAAQSNKCNLKFASGNSYQGECNAKSRPHGKGTYKWTSGSIYVGYFDNGARSGKGRMDYSSGSRYDGEWKADKKNGQGSYWNATGDRFVGEFKAGKMTANGTCFKVDGTSHQGFCKQN
ncbi:MORN repeat-containing protein [Marinibactrum halimedae]|uniref:MORN repeat-containing protein n=1 Tax=Marinibactrum halimedae TaxID=1444977 RepID=UPI001E64DC61|nr:hypothetical protein [Marinibactrum halimedae]MCD9460262.1 hypothetical protein [Marinibactrum halimedae]